AEGAAEQDNLPGGPGHTHPFPPTCVGARRKKPHPGCDAPGGHPATTNGASLAAKRSVEAEMRHQIQSEPTKASVSSLEPYDAARYVVALAVKQRASISTIRHLSVP